MDSRVGDGRKGQKGEKIPWHRRKRAFLTVGFAVLCVLAVLAYFGTRRPHLVLTTDSRGIHVTNVGDLDAQVFRIDGFWYWEGRVGFLKDLPEVKQRVAADDGRKIQLTIGDIPSPVSVCGTGVACFMKLVIHYQIPGVPIFRYRNIVYFRFEKALARWELVDMLPSRYRALGNMGRGAVEMIEVRSD